jgi:hypothetical protein
MPDTKSGREKKGRNKRHQLSEILTEQERRAHDEEHDDEPPRWAGVVGEFVADELPEER